MTQPQPAKQAVAGLSRFVLSFSNSAIYIGTAMSKYGDAAILAVQFLKEGVTSEPRDAWAKATKIIFPASTDLQNKGCPKGAFLGLCNEGRLVSCRKPDLTKLTNMLTCGS